MFLKELSDKIWATKEARFEASKRMHRNRIASTASTCLLSASIIAINLFAFLPQKSTDNDYSIMITLLTVILSLFCLVITALVNFLNYSSREEMYQNCGLELDNLNSQIKIYLENNGDKSTKEQNEVFSTKYSEILSRYKQNHTQIDWLYAKYMDERGKREWVWKGCLSPENIRYYFRSIKYFFRRNIWDVYLVYWLIAILPIIVIVYYIIHSM